MPKPRETQIDLASTPYYHVYSRCVRQAYLFDSESGIDYKQLFVDRIKALSSVFCIDIAAYAVMSNHYHIVVHIDAEKAKDLDDKALVKRWLKVFKNDIAERWLRGIELTKAEVLHLNVYLDIWRKRISDLSWFMRCLNEYIAREANKNEDKKGRFWESRFKSQALLDEAALLTCMQYVDLNPIRAKTPIETLEDSDYTAIQDRLVAYQQREKTKNLKALKARAEHVPLDAQLYPKGLMRFSLPNKPAATARLPFYLNDYIELIEWTGKAVVHHKKGAIPSHLKPILERLGLNADNWLDTLRTYKNEFTQAVGEETKIQSYCKRLTTMSQTKAVEKRETFYWFKGMKQLRKMYQVV